MSSVPTDKINEKCKTLGCGKDLRVRGFCIACYYRNLRNGKILPNEKTNKWKHRLSDIDEVNKTGICSECGLVKLRGRGNQRWRCSKESNERSRDYKRAYRASKKALLKDFCEICGRTEKLCYDHSHKSGNFRGTLCSYCNAGIGLFFDDIDNLKKAISYLENKYGN